MQVEILVKLACNNCWCWDSGWMWGSWVLWCVQMISAEAPVLFAKAAEIFITELTLRAWLHAEDNKRRTLQVDSWCSVCLCLFVTVYVCVYSCCLCCTVVQQQQQGAELWSDADEKRDVWHVDIDKQRMWRTFCVESNHVNHVLYSQSHFGCAWPINQAMPTLPYLVAWCHSYQPNMAKWV